MPLDTPIGRATGVTQAMEALRDQRGLPWLADLSRDARYAVRTLRRSPSFTAVAVLTLGLGISATTAIYSLVDTILLQPLPLADSDRLVRVVENVPARLAGRPPVQRGVSYQDFLDWRARSRTLSDSFAVAPLGQRTVRTREGTGRLWGAMISADAFARLGARAALGRTLAAGDEAHPEVVVISFDTWRSLFQSDAAVVGTTLAVQAPETMFGGASIDARLLTIVGVLPQGFELPTALGSADFYSPFVIESKRSPIVTFAAYLPPGIALRDAVDEANVIGASLRPRGPANAAAMNVPRFDVQNLKDLLVRGVRPAFRVLLAAVAVVLLIVCANVANLLLARGTARQHEFAVRFAIGASRGRVARQVLTECVVLCAAGGVVGALFAAGGIRLVKTLASIEAPGIFRVVFGASLLPRIGEVGVHLPMFGIAFGIAATTSLLCGVLPAVHVSRRTALQAMGTRGSSPSLSASRIRAALVLGQIVLAIVLLVGAGLLLRAFVKLSTVDRGYAPSHVLAFQLVLPADYPINRKTESMASILARIRAMPGVQAAGFTRAGVLIPEEIHVGTFVPQGRTLDEMRADPLRPRLRPASDGYLAAMGVRLLQGREFEATDAGSSAPVIVISRTVAQRYFGAASAVGQFVNWYGSTGPAVPVQIVGVIEDIRNESPDRDASPDIFVDYRQLLELSRRWDDAPQRQDEMALGFLSFAVRIRGDAAAAAPIVAQVVRSADPNAGVDALIPMDRLVASSVARPRFYAVLLGVFAIVAAVLAAIGIYGVLAYAVVQRTHEIGIRMALGAQRAQVLALVLRRGVILTTAGIGIGLAGAAAGTRLLEGMLFGITPLDAQTFAAVPVMFGLVAIAACYLPARRATKVDPIVALRTDG
jgi:putative ABC transport system permease protein